MGEKIHNIFVILKNIKILPPDLRTSTAPAARRYRGAAGLGLR
jgi:hypothetical protein